MAVLNGGYLVQLLFISLLDLVKKGTREMSSIIPAKEVANKIMECLEESVADFPEEEREEAKCRILNAFSEQMFCGKAQEK